MAWLGLLELILWSIFWVVAAEKWYPRLENWALAQVDKNESTN